jgi:hypothetical protein
MLLLLLLLIGPSPRTGQESTRPGQHRGEAPAGGEEGARALGDRHGLMGAVARVVARPLGELLASAVRRDAAGLPVEQQVLVLEAVAGWADGFESNAAARRRSAARLVHAWGGGTAGTVTRAQVLRNGQWGLSIE